MKLDKKFIELIKIGIVAKQLKNPHKDIAIQVLDDAYNIIEDYGMNELLEYNVLWGLAEEFINFEYGNGKRPEWYVQKYILKN